MLRLVSISAVACALASVSSAVCVSSAEADDRMCMTSYVQVEMPFDLTLEQARARMESFEVGPFFSSDGTHLWSSIVVEHLAGQAGREGAPFEILVCYRPNDPRCSPSAPTPDHTPPTITRGAYGALPCAHDWPPILSVHAEAPQGLALGPALGVRSRIERPPQG
jgi:hypothetical protein